MNWELAIEKNTAALREILALLAAMAGGLSRLSGRLEAADDGACTAPATLPRRLHRAVLRLLRPAESAARRLIVIAAREMSAPPPRWRKPKRRSVFMRKPGRTGILLPPGVLPPGVRPRPAPAAIALPLLDRLQRRGRVRQPVPTTGRTTVPRISFPGVVPLSPVPVRHPPAPHDPLDARRLRLRIAAIGDVLDDLPRHALRLARWRARRDAARAAAAAGTQGPGRGSGRGPGCGPERGKIRRLGPLRPGRPPGSLRRPRHEVHALLTELHGLACDALEERNDTS